MAVTNQFKSCLEVLQTEIQEGLDELVFPTEPAYLYDPIRYVIAGKGKRLRPVLVHLSGKAFDAQKEDLAVAGLAVELLHNFTLVHDDIMDQDSLRHGQPTVYHKWDESTAILAGDGIFTISQLLIGRVSVNVRQCFHRFNKATLEICEGQAFDKEFEVRTDVTMDEYLAMIGKKTGNLIGLCAELGALLADQGDDVCRSLFEYGILLGQAFQVQDDILEITANVKNMGKSLGSDIAAGKQTVLTILARDRNASEWKRFQKEQAELPVAELCSVYRDYYTVTGILAQAENIAGELVEQSRQKLLVVPESGRDDLIAFSDYILNRKK